MFPIIAVKDDSLRMCDPWDTIEFLDKMKHIPEDKCDYCLPDCNITIYETTVSSAPFQSCDHTNLESSNMCKLTSGKGFNPPLWINDIKKAYHAKWKLTHFRVNLQQSVNPINLLLTPFS